MFLIISKALAYLPCLMNILARLSLSIESSPLVSGSFTGSGLAGDGAGGAGLVFANILSKTVAACAKGSSSGIAVSCCSLAKT